MTWRYQVVRYPGGEHGIHEIYTHGGKEGMTVNAVGVVADSRWGVFKVLWMMALDALIFRPVDDPDTRWTLTAKGRAMVDDE